MRLRKLPARIFRSGNSDRRGEGQQPEEQSSEKNGTPWGDGMDSFRAAIKTAPQFDAPVVLPDESRVRSELVSVLSASSIQNTDVTFPWLGEEEPHVRISISSRESPSREYERQTRFVVEVQNLSRWSSASRLAEIDSEESVIDGMTLGDWGPYYAQMRRELEAVLKDAFGHSNGFFRCRDYNAESDRAVFLHQTTGFGSDLLWADGDYSPDKEWSDVPSTPASERVSE